MSAACLDCILDGIHKDHEDQIEKWDTGVQKAKNDADQIIRVLEEYKKQVSEKVIAYRIST